MVSNENTEVFNYKFELTPKVSEDRVWRENIADKVKDFPKNIIEICQYGFTEMLNNVIDHSKSPVVSIEVTKTAKDIEFIISDIGIGIFEKIKQSLNLQDHFEAILELSKGKLTTDAQRHSGEGIFFASRMFDKFSISSGNLFYSHNAEKNDWLLEDREQITSGTTVNMQISVSSNRKLNEVFKEFSLNEWDFSRTCVPVKLAQYGDENLISRSQAKRLLNRFEVFREIILDFSKINQIGQAFADEIFRVFINNHPDIKIIPLNCNHEVGLMIKRAQER
ncbi:MAG TPA: DUF4325 domain-containing protein [Candidatus Gastranaerophilales bacterium]|nr:DUF4325 domain-containing protein [Candidatus Gastranaerophilales bacterium]